MCFLFFSAYKKRTALHPRTESVLTVSHCVGIGIDTISRGKHHLVETYYSVGPLKGFAHASGCLNSIKRRRPIKPLRVGEDQGNQGKALLGSKALVVDAQSTEKANPPT